MKNHFDISAINTKVLDQFRLEADPIADHVITKILTSGYKSQINQVFIALGQQESFNEKTFSGLEPGLAKILNEYFENSKHLPEWADPALIKIGEKVFSTYGPAIFMLLNISSLPLCYSCAKGARVLFDTGRLLHHSQGTDPVARRLMDTAQMIMDVMLPGGLTPKGKGIVTIQKVRLIHAAARYYLKQHGNTEPWDINQFGEPINQEDMAGTLMSFAPVTLSGLKHLNAGLSTREMDAYMHCWKIVGYMMGIDGKLLPNTYKEGFDLAVEILKHQAADSSEGKALTQSCIKMINAMVPGNSFKGMPENLIIFFMKDFSEASGIDLCQCIGVYTQAGRKGRIVLSLTKFALSKFSRLEQDAFMRKITPSFNRLLLQGIMNLFNRGKSTRFSIPPSLQKAWIETEKHGHHKFAATHD